MDQQRDEFEKINFEEDEMDINVWNLYDAFK